MSLDRTSQKKKKNVTTCKVLTFQIFQPTSRGTVEMTVTTIQEEVGVVTLKEGTITGVMAIQAEVRVVGIEEVEVATREEVEDTEDTKGEIDGPETLVETQADRSKSKPSKTTSLASTT